MRSPEGRLIDIAAIAVMMDAKEGRYAGLVERLRNPAITLGDDERAFLADLLEGKIVRQAHRQKSWRLPYEHARIARYVQFLEGSFPVSNSVEAALRSASPNLRNKAAVSIAAEEYGVSESTVRNALRSFRRK